MAHGGWGCPYEEAGRCRRVANRSCDPGMKGCVLAGRFLFSKTGKNFSRRLLERTGKRRKEDAGG